MKHALALLLLSCALVAQDKPNSVDSDKRRATELRRMLDEGKITPADLNRMFEEGKISPSVMLMTNVADDAAPTPQAKPAAKVTKAAAAEAPKPAAVETAAESKPPIQYRSINVRDELIVEIHELKLQLATCRRRSALNRSYLGDMAMQPAASNSYFEQARVQHESDITLLIESQRSLILALAELAKEAAKDKPTEVQHSSPFPPKSLRVPR